MSLNFESELGIQLNTFVRHLEYTPACDIRAAKNDVQWHKDTHIKAAVGTLGVASTLDQQNTFHSAVISRRQFNRVRETRIRSLYSFVKLSVVADLIEGFRKSHNTPGVATRVMDIGFAFQPAKRLFNSVWKQLDYTGVNLNSITDSETVNIDEQLHSLAENSLSSLDVVLALDVMPELYKDPEAFNKKLARLSNLTAESSLIMISMPQMNHIPGQKLSAVGNLFAASNLHDRQANHAKHARQLFLHAISKHFVVEQIMGIGFLSTLPDSMMGSRQYGNKNLLGKVCRYLCDRVFQYGPVKTVDLFLTRTLGKLPQCRGLCNGILIVASPRQARISRVKF